MAAVRLRMRQVCERHRGRQLRRVRMRVLVDNGPGHTARELARVRPKVCSVLTMQLIRERTQTAKTA
jgi:hypothetical protein